MMKLSELEKLFAHYESARWSPSRMNVKIGCDCGCGGDMYTAESWRAEEDTADKTIKKMKQFCDKYGIEYDGVE